MDFFNKKQLKLKQEFRSYYEEALEHKDYKAIVEKILRERKNNSFSLQEGNLADILIAYVTKLMWNSSGGLPAIAGIIRQECPDLHDKMESETDSKDSDFFYMDIIGKLFDRVTLKIDFEIDGIPKKEDVFCLVKEVTISELKNLIFVELKQVVSLQRKLFNLLIKLRNIFIKMGKISDQTSTAERQIIHKLIGEYENQKIFYKKTETKCNHLLNDLKNHDSLELSRSGHVKKVKQASETSSVDQYCPHKQITKTNEVILNKNSLEKFFVFDVTKQKFEKNPQSKIKEPFNRLGVYHGVNRNIFTQGSKGLDQHFYGTSDISLPENSDIMTNCFPKHRQSQCEKKGFKLLRFEDYTKSFFEYKGRFEKQNFKISPRNPCVKYANINYDLNTEDEMSLLNAEDCSQSKIESESDDEIGENQEDKDFIVDDDYLSDQDNSKKSIFNLNKKKGSGQIVELKPELIDFSLTPPESTLFKNYSVVNLTGMPFPIKL